MKNISIIRMSALYLLVGSQLVHPAQQQKFLTMERDALRFRQSSTVNTLGQQVARSRALDQSAFGQTRYIDPRLDIIKPLTSNEEQTLLARWNASGTTPSSPHFSHSNHLGPTPARPLAESSRISLHAIERMKQQSAQWFKTIGASEQIKILNRYCINYTQSLDRLGQYLPQEYIKHLNKLRAFANKVATAQFNPAQMIEAIEQNVEIKTGAATMDTHLNRPVLEFKAKIIKILFNPDGSYKGFSNERAQREYAKITAEFLQNYIYTDNVAKYAKTIGKLSEAGFTAFDYFAGSAGGMLEHLRHGTFAVIHASQGFNPFNALQALQSVKHNAFNNDIKQLQRYLENGQFTKAKALLQKYGTSAEHCTVLNDMCQEYLKHCTHNAFQRAGTHIKHIDLSRLTTDQKAKIIAFVEQQNSLSKTGLDMFQKLYIASETNFGLFIHQLESVNGLVFDASTQRELQGIAAQMDPHNLAPTNIDTYCFQIGREYFQLTEAQATQYAKCITEYFKKGDVSLNDFIYNINARIKSNLADINRFCQDIKRQYRIGIPEKDILSEAHLNSRGIKHAETVEDTQRILITQIADNISLSMITQTAETLGDSTLPAPSLESSPHVTGEYDPSRFQSIMASSLAASSSSSSSQPSSSSAGLATEPQTRITTAERDIVEFAFECDRLGIPYPWLPQRTAIPAEDKSDLVFESTGTERYSVVEYMKETDAILAKMGEGPQRELASSFRNWIVIQAKDLKTEGIALKEQLSVMFRKWQENGQMNVEFLNATSCSLTHGVSIEETLTQACEELAKTSEQYTQLIRAIQRLTHNGISYYNENSAKYREAAQMLQRGEVERGAELATEIDYLSHRVADKLAYNAKHPVKFVGKTIRGIVGLADLGIDTCYDFDPMRTPEQQKILSEKRLDERQYLINVLESASPEQVYDFVAESISDIITLAAAQRVYRQVRTAGSSSSAKSTVLLTQHKKFNDILNMCERGQATKGRTKQFLRNANLDKGMKDFRSLNLSNVKKIDCGYTGTFPNRDRVTIRTRSRHGSPTLELRKFNSKNTIKIRYIK